ncbi:MAG: EVE domain-containing protein [Bacillota bacterium]
MAHWLMKTEPDEFSYKDLEQAGREPWNGVRNAVALKHMRAMMPGDTFLFYHTGNEKAIVGVGRVISEPYPDPEAENPKYVAVDTAPGYRFQVPVTLAAIKADERFADWELVRQSRLSVMPVSEEQWGWLHDMGGTEPQPLPPQ